MSDYEGAKRVYEEGLHVLAETNELWLRAQLLCYLGAVAGFSFDFEHTQSYYQQSTRLFEQIGDKSALADLLKDQGGMFILESNYTESIACLLRSIDLCRELGHKQYIATGMGWLAIAVGMREQPDAVLASLSAARLQGATDSLMEAIGLTPWTRTHPMVQTVFQHIRSRVDEQSWNVALNAGKALTMEQAIALAHQIG
jgi:tetratricopeptide (TPR) repeat protein